MECKFCLMKGVLKTLTPVWDSERESCKQLSFGAHTSPGRAWLSVHVIPTALWDWAVSSAAVMDPDVA